MKFSIDLDNAITALEWFIIEEENELSKQNVGDDKWKELETYKLTRQRLKMLRSIYQ